MTARQGRKHRKDQMFALIETYISGTSTQKEFCTENALNYNTFQYWLKSYRKQKLHTHDNQAVFKGFIPITPAPTMSNTAPPCVIEYPNGIKLMLNQIPDVSTLHTLLNPVCL